MNGEYKLARPLSEAQEELRNRLLTEVRKDKYKAVSFKLMGTLVMLPFSGENDIYAFMEKEFSELCPDCRKTFSELRTAAQEAALKKMNVIYRVTLKYIYGILEKTSGISHDKADELMKLECRLFESFAFARECGKALFREAKNNKKRVVITAETIYPEATVRAVIEKCGYGSFDELVMAANIKECTGESFFPEVVGKSGVSADRILHIGGDVAFDVELPIFKGARALMLQEANELMDKSGRIRGFAERKNLFDYDNPDYLALRCAFGLYSAYGFDTPRNKIPMSDFCGDEYSIGFIVLGTLGLDKSFSPKSGFQTDVIAAMEKNERMAEGKADFEKMFTAHFGEYPEMKCSGCALPLEFLEECCASADRVFFESTLSDTFIKKWSRSVKEPEIIHFSAKKVKKGRLSRLADKMFPPGTRVRNIVDGILAKMHR